MFFMKLFNSRLPITKIHLNKTHCTCIQGIKYNNINVNKRKQLILKTSYEEIKYKFISMTDENI